MNLLPQQVKAKEHLSSWRVGALFMEAGTGKTRVAIEIVNSTTCSNVIWIGPYRTIHSDEGVVQEIEKWGGFNTEVTYCGIESLQSSDRIYLGLLDKITTDTFVVVDESLKIKNEGSKRTKRMLEIGGRCGYKLILNGTPLSKNVLDLWSQMEFLSPKILKMNST
ncbi:MAG: SNF2-related protein, partial [Phocaeicola sp.]